MRVYCCVDFHACSQIVSYCNRADGEVHQQQLHHYTDDVCAFYEQPPGDVVAGLEASGYSSWFEELLERLGYQVCVGDIAEIQRPARRRSKSGPTRHHAHSVADVKG